MVVDLCGDAPQCSLWVDVPSRFNFDKFATPARKSFRTTFSAAKVDHVRSSRVAGTKTRQFFVYMRYAFAYVNLSGEISTAYVPIIEAIIDRLGPRGLGQGFGAHRELWKVRPPTASL